MPNPAMNMALMAGGLMAVAYYVTKWEVADGAPDRWKRRYQLRDRPVGFGFQFPRNVHEEQNVKLNGKKSGLGIREWLVEGDSKDESKGPTVAPTEDSRNILEDDDVRKFQVASGTSLKDKSSIKNDAEKQIGSSGATFEDQLEDLDDSEQNQKKNLVSGDDDDHSGDDHEKAVVAGNNYGDKSATNDHSGKALGKNLEKASVPSADKENYDFSEDSNDNSEKIDALDKVKTYDNDDDDTKITISWPEEATLSVRSHTSKRMNYMLLEAELSQTLTACPFLLDAHPRLARVAAMAMAEAVQEWFDAYMADLSSECIDVRKEFLEKMEQELTVVFVGRSGLDIGGGGLQRISGTDSLKPSPPSVLVPTAADPVPTERAADSALRSHADDLRALIASRDAALLGKLSATWNWAVTTAMQDLEVTDGWWDSQEDVLPFNLRVVWRWKLVDEEESNAGGSVVVGLCHA